MPEVPQPARSSGRTRGQSSRPVLSSCCCPFEFAKVFHTCYLLGLYLATLCCFLSPSSHFTEDERRPKRKRAQRRNITCPKPASKKPEKSSGLLTADQGYGHTSRSPRPAFYLSSSTSMRASPEPPHHEPKICTCPRTSCAEIGGQPPGAWEAQLSGHP